jgi:GntR family transcriptional regulator
MDEIDHLGRVPIYVQLAAILRRQIESGELAADRPLPSKATLVARYGVSQGSVERALAVLKADGLVVTVTGRGIYVLPEDERPH